MEPSEICVINSVLIKHFIHEIDGLAICKHLRYKKYIDTETYRSVLKWWHQSASDNRNKTLRVINELVGQITFPMLHAIMSTLGLGDVAHLMAHKMFLQKTGSNSIHGVNKLPVTQRQLQYRIFVKVKTMADFGSLQNPGKDVRRVAMVFKDRFESATDACEKQKHANLYFTVLLSELDNTTFISSEYASYKTLLRELKSVIPYTSHPDLNRSVVFSRRAIVNGKLGRISQGHSDIHSALVLALEHETSPDLCVVIYEQANLLYSEFEKDPTTEALQKLKEVCFVGIQASDELRENMPEISQQLKVHFYSKIACCSLGLNLHGTPLERVEVTENNKMLAQSCLDALEHATSYITMRRKMFKLIARGRIEEIRGNFESARHFIGDARALACKGQFEERSYLKDYQSNLEKCCDN